MLCKSISAQINTFERILLQFFVIAINGAFLCLVMPKLDVGDHATFIAFPRKREIKSRLAM